MDTDLASTLSMHLFNRRLRVPKYLGSVTRLGDILDFGQLLKPLATINMPKSPTFSGIFCKGVKI